MKEKKKENKINLWVIPTTSSSKTEFTTGLQNLWVYYLRLSVQLTLTIYATY